MRLKLRGCLQTVRKMTFLSKSIMVAIIFKDNKKKDKYKRMIELVYFLTKNIDVPFF
jgi:hypothetical protein